jgi:hypothetical protein
MTSSEFEIVFYEAMAKWASGGKVSPDPRGEIEFRPNTTWNWSEAHADQLEGTEGGEYRWKPAAKRTVTIDGVELVAPEVEAPAVGTTVYCPGHWGVSTFTWERETAMTVDYLNYGLVFLTREDAQAMADAQRKQRLGGGV